MPIALEDSWNRLPHKIKNVNAGFIVNDLLTNRKSGFRKADLCQKPPKAFAFNNTSVERDSVVIREVTAQEDQDVMVMAPWKRFVARFLVLTAAIPAVLTFWSSWIQAQTLIVYGKDGVLSFRTMVLAWVFIGAEFLLSSKSRFPDEYTYISFHVLN